ncbi:MULTISPECIES: glycosyltransferase family 4 protein [unclassified Phaeobacter]|uniref:glycosyltransferase family 4 protein n=2 Tax=Phaeobacter TaxID=302485 RepID=UPI003A845A25
MSRGHKIAFYAPMKSPRHPVPSGDREMARNLMGLLAGTGATVTLASELRVYDRSGDTEHQATLRGKAAHEIDRICTEIRATPEADQPALWLTYHNYYKAPDLIGPAVAERLGIPYVQVESTRANKRLKGPWSDFARAAHEAADAAAVIFYLTEQDHETLLRDRYADQRLVHLPPFLTAKTLPTASDHSGPLLSVGMMRPGDKLASYRLLADALARISQPWRLNIVGDGPARPEVETLMRPFGEHVRFFGELNREALEALYQQASLFLWPGVNEAFGMVYLEAQAHGVPVVAQDRPGLCDVVTQWEEPDLNPTTDSGAAGYARALERALDDGALRNRQAKRARDRIATRHLAPVAAQKLWATLSPLLEISS